MFWLRIYELSQLEFGHETAYWYIWRHVGPGFLNAVNRYYGWQVWEVN